MLALLRLTEPSAAHRRDVFDPSRRVEQAYPREVLPLAAMVPGYRHNRAAARATLDWLAARFPLDPAIADPVRALLSA